jgi:transcriptional regulator with XRE-family HTH domain
LKEVILMIEAAPDQRREAVEVVARIQRERRTPDGKRLTDAVVAERIGVTQTAWTLARNGKRQPGHRMMRGMMAEFPETIPLLMSFFLPGGKQ